METKESILKDYFKLGVRIFERCFNHPTKAPYDILTERFKTDRNIPQEDADFYNIDCWNKYVEGYEYAKNNPSQKYLDNSNPSNYFEKTILK